MADEKTPTPDNPPPSPVGPIVNITSPTPATTVTTSGSTDETWAQWLRSDKALLLGLYVFLMFSLFHAEHDGTDKDLVGFLENMVTGAFSGLMVALRGSKTSPTATTTTSPA